MYVVCADFDQKLEEVLLVHHYDLFLSYFGSHSSAEAQSQAGYCMFFRISIVFLYFGLNLRHKWMQDTHCGKQPKLSKTTGVPIIHFEKNN